MLLKLSRFFVCGALFSILIAPFAGYDDGYYFFRVAVELALACLVLWWGFEAPPGVLRERLARIAADQLFRAVSLFVLAFLAACLFAYDRNAAFWSGYTRGDGGFQMLHYLAFFILLLLVFDTAKHWRLALTFTVTAACLSIAYGILAAALVPSFLGYLDPAGIPTAPTFFGRLLSNTRFMGSLANPAYFATTMLFALAFALYLAFTSRWRPGWGKWLFYAAVIFFLLVFLVLSQTRGALLGLTAGVVSFFAYLAFSDVRYRRRAAAGILILAALSVTAFFARDSLIMLDTPGQRLLHLDVREVPVRGRLWAWNSAWQGFQERPLLGWGPENFGTVFDRHFGPSQYVPIITSEPWEDRAHSIFFDYLAETGLVGLAAYAGIFAVFYAQLFRNLHDRRKGTNVKHPISPFTPALFFAVPVAYLVQGLVFFDVLAIYLNLFLFLALSAHWFRCQN